MTKLYVTTSWDDGHPADLHIAQLLDTYGLRGTFYIPRQWRLPTLNPAEITSLGGRFEVGGHTINHVSLTNVPDTQAQAEIRDAKHWVEDQTGVSCQMFCPPNGHFSSRHVGMIASAGYIGFRTVEMWSDARPRARGQVYEMPTLVQAYPINPAAHLRNVCKRMAIANAPNLIRNGVNTDWTRAAQTQLDRLLKTGGVFHLWGHSWEVDELDQWEPLERVFQAIHHRLDRIEVVTNGQLVAHTAGISPESIAGSLATSHAPQK